MKYTSSHADYSRRGVKHQRHIHKMRLVALHLMLAALVWAVMKIGMGHPLFTFTQNF